VTGVAGDLVPAIVRRSAASVGDAPMLDETTGQ
jgi:hypothetical protein